jgi:DNA-binding MarR family transcriptional regulator
MNVVLRGLQDRGLLTRPDTVASGRARPTELTHSGRRLLAEASAAVRAVEQRMLTPFTPARRHQLRSDLAHCAAALEPS